jgi:hypothetical protein
VSGGAVHSTGGPALNQRKSNFAAELGDFQA